MKMEKKMSQSYTLESVERDLQIYESVENPVTLAWENACEILSISKDSAYFQLGDYFSHLSWFNEVKNKYHNGVHTAQVIHSGAVLLSLEKENNPFVIDPHVFEKAAPYYLIALMFHDYKHTGKTNKSPFELEEFSCEQFTRIVLLDEAFYNFWIEIEFDIDDKLSFIHSIILNFILATEVTKATKEYRNNYLKEKNDNSIEAFSVLSMLMAEADLLSSVLPDIGKVNGRKLAEELDIPVIATSAGRIGFLKEVKYVSFASEKLKIQESINNEIIELLK